MNPFGFSILADADGTSFTRGHIQVNELTSEARGSVMVYLAAARLLDGLAALTTGPERSFDWEDVCVFKREREEVFVRVKNRVILRTPVRQALADALVAVRALLDTHPLADGEVMWTDLASALADVQRLLGH